MKQSHKRVLDLLKAGVELTTVDVGHPSFFKYGVGSLGSVRRRTLAEMEELGLIHCAYNYTGDGSTADCFWHLGKGESDEMKWCSKCGSRQCVVCHPCFKIG